MKNRVCEESRYETAGLGIHCKEMTKQKSVAVLPCVKKGRLVFGFWVLDLAYHDPFSSRAGIGLSHDY